MTDIAAPGTDAQPSAPQAAPQEKISWAIRRVMILLALVSTLNFVDRFIINILAEDIKIDLHLSDTQLGLVTGLAFAIFYALLSIPGARLADKVNRPRLLSGAIFFWSAATMLCAMANNFIQLVLARVCVGVGEAPAGPAGQSLLTDSVPLSRRAHALSFYAMGAPLGALIGLGLGGVVVDQFGWRNALFIVGLPGFALGLLLLLVREPRDGTAVRPENTPLVSFFRELWAKRSARWLFVAVGLGNMVQMGKYAFQVSFFLRVWKEDLAIWVHWVNQTFHVSLGAVSIIGLVLGIGSGITAMTGIYIGGRLSDALGRKDISAVLWLPACAKLAVVPLGLGSMFAPTFEISLALMLLAGIGQGFTVPAVYAAQVGLVKRANRATVISVFLVAQTLLGLGLGPLFIGTLSDMFNHLLLKGSADGLRYSFIVTYTVLIPTALCLWMASRHYKKDFVE